MKPILFFPWTKTPASQGLDQLFPSLFTYCGYPHDYEDSLFALWSANTDIIVIEHDIVATDEHIEELVECLAPLCAFAYKVYPISSGRQEAFYPHANRDKTGTKYTFVKEGEHWADHAALGLTKFSQHIRHVVERPNLLHDEWSDWRNLDTRLSQAFNDQGLGFHIHWPEVEHLHKGEGA